MPELTRRRNPDAPDECWHVFYGDVHVGSIAVRTGTPHHEDPWGWACGFYRGAIRESARAAQLPHLIGPASTSTPRGGCSCRTEADFQAWRDQRDWTAEKYRRFDRHERMPRDWRASG